MDTKELIDNLIEKKISITTAESCTGGLIASEITKYPGVSSIYSGSVVVYSNKMKQKLLNVSSKTLEYKGAVSSECVEEMCESVSKLFDADIAIAVSGIAGPDGGTEFKPVGTVFIGVKFKDILKIEEHHFSGDRNSVQQSAKNRAFEMVLDFF